MYGKGLRTLSTATVVAIAASFSLVFFYAPLDADQGFIQKIFYLHVPLAITALCGFVAGGVFATSEGGLPPKMWVTFLVCIAGAALLWETLIRFELAAKTSRAKLGRLRRALAGEGIGAGGSRIAPIPRETEA